MIVEHRVDVARTLGVLRRGPGDPAYRVDADGLWRTTTTPDGGATLRMRVDAGSVTAEAWGPGATWALAAVPDSLGVGDDVTGFAPEHPMLADAWRRYPGVRIPRTRRVWDALVAAVLEQKVTGAEAYRAWRDLLRVAGEPAPGPAPDGMRVPPVAGAVLAIPDWTWHRCGIDGQRRRTLLAAATVADRLEEAVDLPRDEALRRLRAVPGIGVWTAAEIAQRAFGDADAPSVGDYHIPGLVGWALAGGPVDDDGMLELLEPYRPHRHRVVRLVMLAGKVPPRRGPRAPVRNYRGI